MGHAKIGALKGRSSDYKLRSVNECKMCFFNKYHVSSSLKKTRNARNL